MTKPNITKIKGTCVAYPTQFEGRLDNGKMFCFYWRWGYLQIWESINPTYDPGDAIFGNSLFNQKIDLLDHLPAKDVIKYLSEVYELSDEIKNTITEFQNQFK